MNKILLTVAVIAGFLLGTGFQESRVIKLKHDHTKVLLDISNKTGKAQEELLNYINAVRVAETKKDAQHYERVQELKTDLANSELALAEWLQLLSEASTTPTVGTNNTTVSRRASVKDQATFDLFIDMLAGNTKELVAVGKYADELKVAGLRCEDRIDAYTDPQQPSKASTDTMIQSTTN